MRGRSGRKPAELAACVREHVEAGAVRCPRAGKEDRVVVVRRQLARFSGLEVDQVNRRVAVVPDVERQQLRTVRRELAGKENMPSPNTARVSPLPTIPNPDLHVGRVARVRRVGELRPVGCPRGSRRRSAEPAARRSACPASRDRRRACRADEISSPSWSAHSKIRPSVGDTPAPRTVSSVNAVSWSGQPPSTGTRQRLNCPDMLLANSNCDPSAVNANDR